MLGTSFPGLTGVVTTVSSDVDSQADSRRLGVQGMIMGVLLSHLSTNKGYKSFVFSK